MALALCSGTRGVDQICTLSPQTMQVTTPQRWPLCNSVISNVSTGSSYRARLIGFFGCRPLLTTNQAYSRCCVCATVDLTCHSSHGSGYGEWAGHRMLQAWSIEAKLLELRSDLADRVIIDEARASGPTGAPCLQQHRVHTHTAR